MPKIRGAQLVAAGILLSRVAGIVREIAISVALGNAAAADAFRVAMRVPNFLQNLLGEGSLSASFVPVYAGLVEKGKTREADGLASAVVSLLAIATSVIVLLLVLLAGPIVRLFTNFEGDKYDLTVDLTRITSVGIGFLVIAAWCLGILNSHRSFFLSYASPVIWNIAQVSMLVVATLSARTEFDTALALAVAMVIGSALQLGVQVPKVLRLVRGLRPNLHKTDALTDVLTRFLPAVGARGVVQISSLMDTVLAASFLLDGGVSSFTFALTIYLLPISLFGFSIAVSELTEMSRKSDSLDIVTERVTHALRRVAIPAGFVSMAYVVAGRPIIDALYGWPSRLLLHLGVLDELKFDDGDVTTVAIVVGAFGLGLPAAISARIVQNTLYALGEVKGPARIAVARLLVGIAFGVLFMFQLDLLSVDGREIVGAENLPSLSAYTADRVQDGQSHLGAAGLALGAAAAAWAEFVLLRVLLARRLGKRIVTGWFTQIFFASVASGVTMYLVGKVSIVSPLDVVVVLTSGAIIYGGVLWTVGIRPVGKVGKRP